MAFDIVQMATSRTRIVIIPQIEVEQCCFTVDTRNWIDLSEKLLMKCPDPKANNLCKPFENLNVLGPGFQEFYIDDLSFGLSLQAVDFLAGKSAFILLMASV